MEPGGAVGDLDPSDQREARRAQLPGNDRRVLVCFCILPEVGGTGAIVRGFRVATIPEDVRHSQVPNAFPTVERRARH